MALRLGLALSPGAGSESLPEKGPGAGSACVPESRLRLRGVHSDAAGGRRALLCVSARARPPQRCDPFQAPLRLPSPPGSPGSLAAPSGFPDAGTAPPHSGPRASACAPHRPAARRCPLQGPPSVLCSLYPRILRHGLFLGNLLKKLPLRLPQSPAHSPNPMTVTSTLQRQTE